MTDCILGVAFSEEIFDDGTLFFVVALTYGSDATLVDVELLFQLFPFILNLKLRGSTWSRIQRTIGGVECGIHGTEIWYNKITPMDMCVHCPLRWHICLCDFGDPSVVSNFQSVNLWLLMVCMTILLCCWSYTSSCDPIWEVDFRSLVTPMAQTAVYQIFDSTSPIEHQTH